MKGICSFASLAILALASEDVGPWNYSAVTSKVMLETECTADDCTTNPGTNIKWTMITSSAHDLDNGKEYFRVEHVLEAPIKSTDKVSFEIGFTVDNDPWSNKLVMANDLVSCDME